jgi:hypothetical protein
VTDRAKALFSSSYEYFAGRTLARLDGLTDDEYLWEPVDGCWTVHVVDGRTVIDWEFPPPDPVPVTTIAWRLVHIGSVLREHALRAVAFDRGTANHVPPTVLPLRADAAIAMVRDAMDVWRGDLARVDDARLWELLGPEAGQYAQEPVAAFVEHIHDELVHHAAEVALLRDLYAHRPLR